MEFAVQDRVELTEDLGDHCPALKKGRQGRVVTFPFGKEEAKLSCFVKFDHYTPGVVVAPYTKLKKI